MSIGQASGDTNRAMHMGLGMSSPLWPTFVLAAGAGVAYWAWSRVLQDRLAPVGDRPGPAAADTADKPEQSAPAGQAAPVAANDPPAKPKAVLVEAPAAELDETLGVQGASDADSAPAPKAARKPARPAAAEPDAEPAVIEAAPTQAGGAKAGHRADMLGSAATPEPATPRAFKVKADAVSTPPLEPASKKPKQRVKAAASVAAPTPRKPKAPNTSA